MKVHIKAFCLLFSGLLIINFMSFGALVYAAPAPSVGSTIPFGSLPTEQQDPFLKAIKQFIHDFFGLCGEDKFTYIDPDTGEQFVGTESEIRNYIYSHADELGVKGVQDDSGNLVRYIIDPDVLFSTAEANVCYDIVSCYIEAAADAEYIYTEHGITYSMAADLYNEALKNAGAAILGKAGSGLLNIGMEVINGVPQNVTTIKEDSYISVFDTLGLQYIVAPSLFDFQFNNVTNNSYVPDIYYTPYFITSDKKLYLFQSEIHTHVYGNSNLLTYVFYSGTSHSNGIDLAYVLKYSGRFSFRFVDNSNHLYFCLLDSHYYPSNNTLYYIQYTNGRPGVSNAPLLFYDYRDGLEAPASAELNFEYINYTMPDGIDISFVNSVDNSDVLTDSEILPIDIIAAGYFQGSKNSIRFDSSTLNTAGQMLLSSENVVSGGDKTITSDLSDWQKAIYVLAQQQGISFEELLSKMDLLIDSNGEITLLGLDGIEYSVSELSKKFDEIIGAVGDISGDLSKLLEYLKSLNIEGIDKYILSIEGTLNDLNERDKDNSAVLGDMSGTLTELKEIFQDLDVSDISSKITSIDKTLEKIDVREQNEEDFKEFVSGIILEQQASNFNLYNQCKLFLDNLFNYSDRNNPPSFQFYYDSNGDGENEVYTLLDLSFLDTVLTNENMVDKSFWASPIKVIDFIRYVIAIVCYGLFVMRLIKRLPTFYGNGPLSFL